MAASRWTRLSASTCEQALGPRVWSLGHVPSDVGAQALGKPGETNWHWVGHHADFIVPSRDRGRCNRVRLPLRVHLAALDYHRRSHHACVGVRLSMPEKYRENQRVELAGKGGWPIKTESQNSRVLDDIAKYAEQLDALERSRSGQAIGTR